MAPHVPVLIGVAAVGIGLAIYQNREEVRDFVDEGIEDLKFGFQQFLAKRRARSRRSKLKEAVVVSSGSGRGDFGGADGGSVTTAKADATAYRNSSTGNEKSIFEYTDPETASLDEEMYGSYIGQPQSQKHNTHGERDESRPSSMRCRHAGIHNRLNGENDTEDEEEAVGTRKSSTGSIFYDDPEDDIWVVSKRFRLHKDTEFTSAANSNGDIAGSGAKDNTVSNASYDGTLDDLLSPFGSEEIKMRHKKNPNLTRSWTEVEEEASLPSEPATPSSEMSDYHTVSSVDRHGSTITLD